jgi:hypothetical protein
MDIGMDSLHPLHHLRSVARAEDFVQVELAYEMRKFRELMFQADLRIKDTIRVIYDTSPTLRT